MIEYLRISKLALLDEARLDFSGGFSVVTGETGAGKSVLLGALSILAGNRCSKDAVMSGARSCRVEVLLRIPDTSKIDGYLEGIGAAKCEDSSLLISRCIYSDKPSRAFVNGTPVSLSNLAGLGEYWIDFHGPGEPQRLFSTKNQLAMLDSFMPDSGLVRDYRKLFKARADVVGQMDDLKKGKKLGADEIEFLKTQIGAIDAVNPTVESVAKLEERFKTAEKSRDIVEKSSAVYSLLCGDGGVLEKVESANRLASEIATAGGSAAELADRVKSLCVEISDVASDYETLAKKCDMDDGEIEFVRAKMSAWLDLARKYGASAGAVLSARGEMQKKLDSQFGYGESLEKLRVECENLEGKLFPLCGEIFSARAKAAKSLSAAVEKILPRLGFKNAEFSVSVEKSGELDADCGSSCEFLFCPNPGQELRGLSKIASSGELARVMLALKTVLAEIDNTPVLVFDEVDANVGGEIGAEVGRQLSALAARHHVLCVTHLPQVAACANEHFLVEKKQTKNSTLVEISQIGGDENARIRELARMIGDRKSESAIAHAERLLHPGI